MQPAFSLGREATHHWCLILFFGECLRDIGLCVAAVEADYRDPLSGGANMLFVGLQMKD